MKPTPTPRSQLIELRQSLDNLARSTTIGRPLSPLFLHEQITKQSDRLGAIIDQLPADQVGAPPSPATSPASEPKKGKMPEPVKPV